MGFVAQIVAYLVAVVLPVAIVGSVAIAFGWPLALAFLLGPMIILFVFGLSKASY
jgi:hypothetical protein